MPRAALALLCCLSFPAGAANIDFGGFAFDRQPYEAFARASAMTCYAQGASSTCSGEISIEGVKTRGVAIWRRTKKGELVLAQGTADVACDAATVRRIVDSGSARWGKPSARRLGRGQTLWSWRDPAGNRAAFSDAPDAGRPTCTLLVEDGRWARE